MNWKGKKNVDKEIKDEETAKASANFYLRNISACIKQKNYLLQKKCTPPKKRK